MSKQLFKPHYLLTTAQSLDIICLPSALGKSFDDHRLLLSHRNANVHIKLWRSRLKQGEDLQIHYFAIFIIDA